MIDVLDLFGVQLQPLVSAGLWWPARQALIVADMHLEKASHFASRGQPLPPYDTLATLDALSHDMAQLGAKEVWCLGDSFHDIRSYDRLDEETRLLVRRLTRAVEWTWVTGNHDPQVHPDLGGRSVADAQVDGLTLRHEAQPQTSGPELSGHFHPKLWINARGRTIGRRCFAVSDQRIILPAFGALTGGLDVSDPAIRAVMGASFAAVIVADDRLLRYPIAPARKLAGDKRV
jgi:uncharacterized protein